MDTARIARLTSENQRLKYLTEEQEHEMATLRTELKKAQDMQHQLGESCAKMNEAGVAMALQLQAALAKVETLENELKVERQISAERMDLVIEERRRLRQSNGGGAAAYQLQGARAGESSIGASGGQQQHAVAIGEVLEALSETGQPPRLPSLARVEHLQKPEVSARYVAYGLKASRSQPSGLGGGGRQGAQMLRASPSVVQQARGDLKGGRFGTSSRVLVKPGMGSTAFSTATRASGLPGAAATMKLVHPSLGAAPRAGGLAGAGGICVLP